MIKSLTPEVVKGKKILMRVDFNVPLDEQGRVIDDYRIKRIIPTIRFLLENNCRRIILISHFGRPEKSDFWSEEFSLRPVAKHFQLLLSKEDIPLEPQDIHFLTEPLGKDLFNKIENIAQPSIILLENIRFYEEENQNKKDFARQLARLGDLYINEAFSVSHRIAASLCAITEFLPSFAGLLFQEEIQRLTNFLHYSNSPEVFILGGAKVKDKLPLIEKFLERADYILTGGVLANTILKSWNFEIGKSIYEQDVLGIAEKLGSRRAELILPGDFWVLTKFNKKRKRGLGKISRSDMILDIGPLAAVTFAKIIGKAATIFWNGPLGMVENRNFIQGTEIIKKAIFNNKTAQIVIGGGDTISAWRDLSSGYKIENTGKRFFSTGGGATLQFLAKETLPALEALEQASADS